MRERGTLSGPAVADHAWFLYTRTTRLTLHLGGPRLAFHMAISNFGIADGSFDFRMGLVQRSAAPGLSQRTVPEWFRRLDWPMAAARMLSASWDGMALSELAGEGARTDSISIDELINRTMPELGLREPSYEEAVWCVTLIQCALVADNQSSPKQAADTIIALTLGSAPGSGLWTLFLDFAEGLEWDDAPSARTAIEAAWMKTIDRYNARYARAIGASILSATSASNLLN
jgi:hypothetical protein